MSRQFVQGGGGVYTMLEALCEPPAFVFRCCCGGTARQRHGYVVLC